MSVRIGVGTGELIRNLEPFMFTRSDPWVKCK